MSKACCCIPVTTGAMFAGLIMCALAAGLFILGIFTIKMATEADYFQQKVFGDKKLPDDLEEEHRSLKGFTQYYSERLAKESGENVNTDILKNLHIYFIVISVLILLLGTLMALVGIGGFLGACLHQPCFLHICTFAQWVLEVLLILLFIACLSIFIAVMLKLGDLKDLNTKMKETKGGDEVTVEDMYDELHKMLVTYTLLSWLLLLLTLPFMIWFGFVFKGAKQEVEEWQRHH